MKKKSTIIVFSLMLLAIIALSITMIRAWLTDTNTTQEIDLTIGDVTFGFSGSLLASDSIVVPGQNLVNTAFTLTNASNIDTELRFSLSAKYHKADTDIDALSLIITNIDTNKWIFDNGFYYFRDTNIVQEVEGKYIIPAGTQILPILSSIVINGDLVGNDFANITFTFNITFEAKQSDYVTWSDLGSISFSSGI